MSDFDNPFERDNVHFAFAITENKNVLINGNYAIPEHTWYILHDALLRGEWTDDWDARYHQMYMLNNENPDTPSLAELRLHLSRLGVDEEAMRDFILVAVQLSWLVYKELDAVIKEKDIPAHFDPELIVLAERTAHANNDKHYFPIRWVYPFATQFYDYLPKKRRINSFGTFGASRKKSAVVETKPQEEKYVYDFDWFSTPNDNIRILIGRQAFMLMLYTILIICLVSWALDMFVCLSLVTVPTI